MFEDMSNNEAQELKPLGEIVEMVSKLSGFDLSDADVIAEYEGPDNVRRWIMQRPDKEWVLLFDIGLASPMQVMMGGGSNAIFLSSSPMLLLSVDKGFSIIEHAHVYDAVRDAMKTRGVKDGTPYLTVSSVSPMQAMMLRGMIDTLGWSGVNVALEPIGESASGMTFYADGDGDWTPRT